MTEFKSTLRPQPTDGSDLYSSVWPEHKDRQASLHKVYEPRSPRNMLLPSARAHIKVAFGQNRHKDIKDV